MQLDVNRAARVYGSSRAAWFQDGQYFTGAGEPISFEEAAKPAPEDMPTSDPSAQQTPEQAASPVLETVKAPPPPPEYAAIVEKPVERQAGDKHWGDDPRQKLKGLKPVVLAAMVMKAGGTPVTGRGGKKANLEWLVANLKD